ncbi:MAG: DUF2283 domain-containing protein [Planctomycetota bacterium]
MTRDIYLEMTYRHGKVLAGYLYLPRRAGDEAVRSQKAAPGLVVDYATDGRPIGIEVTAPSVVSLETINQILAELHQETLNKEELAPLLVK